MREKIRPTHGELLPDVQQGVRPKLESHYIFVVLLPPLLCRKQRILLAQSGDHFPQDWAECFHDSGPPEDLGTAEADPKKQARWTRLE